MTERLTDKNFRLGFNDSNKLPSYESIYEKLREYENADEEGRMMVLPCDTVYFIWNKSSGISHVRAKSILDLSLREILGIDKDGRYWSVKEEAEKALKEMEGKA